MVGACYYIQYQGDLVRVIVHIKVNIAQSDRVKLSDLYSPGADPGSCSFRLRGGLNNIARLL